MADEKKSPLSLDELRQKIEAASPESTESSEDASTRSGIAKAMRLGTDLLAGVGVGGVIGYFLDDALGTSPLCLILFFFLGFAAGVRNILRNAANV